MAATVQQAGRNEEGFTLIEMIMVLIIMAIVSTIAISRMPSSLDLYAYAEQMAQDIRYTQSLSMNRQEVFGLYRTGGDTYRIRYQNSGATSDYDTSDRTVSGATISTTLNALWFNRLGVPVASDGATALSNDVTVTLSDGENSALVTVVAETGLVQVTIP